jgi:ribose transport system ATP-binding protein
MTEVAPELAVELRGIGMSFSSVPVLQGVDFALQPGVVHAIVGHNGAGKSTLMKIAQGVHRPTDGQVFIGGQELDSADPMLARALGLGMVFQEKSLIPTLNGLDNMFLNAEKKNAMTRVIRRGEEAHEAADLCRRLKISSSLLQRKVSELSAVELQMLEIAKALRLASKALILDEPTAPLGHREIGLLFEIVRNIADQGTGVILITHHLTEVFEVSDKVTVLREGQVTLSCPTRETSVRGLVKAMLEDKLVAVPTFRASGHTDDDPVLDVRSLRVGSKLSDISLRVGAGEITGLAGLAGSGRTTLVRTLFGDIRPDAGDVTVHGKAYRPRHPSDAIRRGVYLVPEDRAIRGLILTKPLVENSSLSVLRKISTWGVLRTSVARRRTRAMMDVLGIRARSTSQVVSELSGGNQQKVVVSKVLQTEPRLLLLDEPTFGVDVGAASDLAEYIRKQADEGMAVLWASSDLRELTSIADRILVLADGVIRHSIDRSSPDFTESALIEAMQRRSDRGPHPHDLESA